MQSIAEVNKRKVQLFVDAVINEGRLELIDDLIAADYLGHIPCADTAVTGPAGVRQLVSSGRHAHPGLHIKIEDQIAEEDRVVTRWLATTTPAGGPAPGAPAQPIPCWTGISITRLLAGKQVDSCTECSRLIPARPATPARSPGP
jgi:hypothetical protein